MTDAKQEALRQALYYHSQSMASHITMSEKATKKPSPQQIVTTAKVFEAFLYPNAKKR